MLQNDDSEHLVYPSNREYPPSSSLAADFMELLFVYKHMTKIKIVFKDTERLFLEDDEPIV